jgi:acetate kinase
MTFAGHAVPMKPAAEKHPIPVAISAHHVHLMQSTINQIFGENYALTPRSPLSQPGQYAARETVNLIGPHGRLEHVRVLGPPRSVDQVEISRTEARALGITVPLRLSGDLEATPGITLEGPCGKVVLRSGVVCALRHIHMSPTDANRLGVRDHEVVEVEIDTDGRPVIFGEVVVRVSPDYRLEFHLDTDEGNAASVGPGTVAHLTAAHLKSHEA